MKKTIYLISTIIILIVSGFTIINSKQRIPEETKELKDGLYAVIDTDKGKIICELDYEKSPLTVANFVGLAEGKIKNNHKPKGSPFYDGLTFHRHTDNFVIQGGDPNGDGSGTPGYKFTDEFNQTLKHDKAGILSMANSGANTNGCQFFITLRAIPQLDNSHSIFGNVVKGIEIVQQIRQGDKIKSVKIIKRGKKVENYDPLNINLKIKIEDFLIR